MRTILALLLVSIAPARGQAPAAAASCRVLAEIAECASGTCGAQAPLAKYWGSGTLVDADGGRGLVLTCAHVVVGEHGETPQQVICYFPGGSSHGARVVAIDPEADLAALVIAQPPAAPAAVAPLDGSELAGATYTASGFGGDGEFRAAAGALVRVDPDGAPQQNLVLQTAVRGGDSGGGAFDARGRLVGVVWGCDGAETYVTCGGPLRRLLQRALGPRLEVVVRGGACAPGGAGAPAGGGQAAAIGGEDSAGGAGCRCAGCCDCEARWAALDGRFAALDKRLDARFAAASLQAGPRGERGPAGPAGRDAAAIDETALAERVAAMVLAKLPASSPAAARGVSHYVLVADEGAESWPRLRDEFRRARESYSGLRFGGLPDVPVGVLPQLVAYRDGKPLGAFRGGRDVSDALARLARGTAPLP